MAPIYSSIFKTPFNDKLSGNGEVPFILANHGFVRLPLMSKEVQIQIADNLSVISIRGINESSVRFWYV